ncbi:MAG TPA: Calx-beta domain-containing protein, partial [Nitrosopumilaceae archaeon]|nr:Calx-beta domain-containing protein [Nitrosopumilaceae archaeon]
GSTNFVFNVNRTSNVGAMSVDYQTEDVSAISPDDYTEQPLATLDFVNGGVLTKTVTVPIVADSTIELDETFNVNLSNCDDCNITVPQGVGTIQNDDFPDVSITNVTLAEGTGGSTNFVFNVNRTSNVGAMSVDYQTADVSASSPDDYAAQPLAILDFVNGGVLTKTVTVPIVTDSTIELDETFNVNLSNCVGCNIIVPQGVGTIDNDDFPTITINDVTQVEGNSGTSNFAFDVTRSSNIGTPSVQFLTADNTATSPSDFTPFSLTTINFGHMGSLTQTVTVPVVGDVALESNETFNVDLSNCIECTILDAQGIGTIIDEDAVGPHTQSFGSSGPINGQFNNPSDIAVDSTGRILVADTLNNRIQTFNSAGVHQSQFGSAGSGNGQFNTPSDIAVDSTGRILVVDSNNHRIQIFNSAGVYQSQFGSSGSGNGEFSFPSGIAVGFANKILVADTGNNRVQVFNSAGVYLSQFGSFGSGIGQFSLPSGITADSTDRIIVADSNNHRIQIFNSAGVYQSQFGSQGSINGQFSNPTGIAVKSLDRILVADTNNDRVQVFDSSGSHIQSFGSEGSANGMFNNPGGLGADSTDRIIVADTSNHRVQVFLASTLNDLDSDGIPDSLDTENVITSSKTITSSHTVGNVTVQNGVVLTIPNGLSVTITPGNNLTIQSGGGVFIQSGGNLQVQSLV